MNEDLRIYLLIFFSAVFGVLVYIFLGIASSYYENMNFSHEEASCTNLSLTNTAYCLRNVIKPYFNYTMRTDFKRSIEDIQKNGGDCYDYSNYYLYLTNDLDVYSTKVSIPINETMGHGFVIISNNEGYCLLDQINSPYCAYI